MLIIQEMGRGWVYLDHDQCEYVPSYTAAAQYAAGITQPHYPVPSLIVHVGNAGLANGLEQRNLDGSLAFKVWDTPMPDGEYVTGNMFDATPWSEYIDVTDWY